jgi:hypothetical protein
MHECATQRLLQLREQVKITWSQVRTVGRMEKKVPLKSAK